MNGSDKPAVTIVHCLPGRFRVRLSRSPLDAEKTIAAVTDHEGMRRITYTPVTRSLLVHFDPGQVTQEEIVFRIALSLSLDYAAVPVRILAEPERHDIGDGAVYSAFLLFASLASRLTRQGKPFSGPLDWIAGLGTACAVLDHAWKDLQEHGVFHPEVLSLGYLLTAFTRGNFLKASLVTWFMTFGRHLLETPRSGVEVRPMKVGASEGSEARYEVLVGSDRDATGRSRLISGLQALVKFGLTGGGSHLQRNLLDELRDVSQVHGEVVEGLGWMPSGVQMRFR